MVISKSKVKELVKNCNVAGDFAESLNKVVLAEIKNAVRRTNDNGRKTVSQKDVFVGKIKAKENVVVKSKVKETIGKNNNVSSDFAEGLNEFIVGIVEMAEARAVANKRKTVQARDL